MLNLVTRINDIASSIGDEMRQITLTRGNAKCARIFSLERETYFEY